MENYIFIALLSAALFSLANYLVKRLSTNMDEYTLGLSRNLFSLPILLVALFFTGVPKVPVDFWPLIIVLAIVEVGIAILLTNALKLSPISLTMPFFSFTTFFVAIGGVIVLREQLTLMQVGALMLFVLGTYLINIDKHNLKNILLPIKKLTKEKGPLLMLILTIIWGITIPLNKQAVLFTSPYFFVVAYYSLFVAFFLPIFLMKNKHGGMAIKKNFLNLIILGLVNGAFFLAFYIAAELGPIAIASSLLSLHILFSVIMGGVLLKEKGIMVRLIAAALMVLGNVILILTQ